MKPFQRILSLFKPQKKSITRLILLISLPVCLLICLITTVMVMLFTSPNIIEEGIEDAEAIYLIIAFFFLPLMALLIGSVALREPRYPARALLASFSTLLILISGIMLVAAMLQDSTIDYVAGAFFFLAIVCPLALIFSLPAVYAIIRTIPEVRAILIEQQEERLLAYIEARRSVSFSDISATLDIPLQEVDNKIDALLANGKLAGSMNVDQQWIHTAAYLAAKQRQLLEWIDVHGRITMKDLGKHLDVSVSQVYEWIYQLVQRNQFSGYVHWENQMVYAGFAKKMGDKTKCPQCGGTLSPAPGERIVCLHCGTECWNQQAEI